MTKQTTSQSQIMADYGDGPNRLEKAIAGLSESDLDLSLSSDSWTIQKIVHHVADGDDIWKSFIKQAIGNPGGDFTLQWYWKMPQDEWTTRWSYAERAIEPSLALFRANRGHIVQLLEHSPEAMEKCLRVRWPKGVEQDVSVEWVIDMQTKHLEMHIDDIGMIREAHDL
jgi:hypothetical protein